ncbi:hypothetical protein RIF29_16066 [Crotalaria pallida]|uniref:Secreted protein n=1 Tax=Crotalaria pallida TaxID=3830 RepID=A0AAN9FLP7_CROPI
MREERWCLAKFLVLLFTVRSGAAVLSMATEVRIKAVHDHRCCWCYRLTVAGAEEQLFPGTVAAATLPPTL